MSDSDRNQTLFCVSDDRINAKQASDSKKCDDCRFTTETRFLLAGSRQEVREMISGDGAYQNEPYNGFCGRCMCDMLATNVGIGRYTVVPEDATPSVDASG